MGKEKIIFFNGRESFLYDLFYKLQRIVELLDDIDKKDLFYIVGSPEGQEFYDQECLKNKWKNKLNILPLYIAESVTAGGLHQIQEHINYEIRPKEKLFVCFNRVHRTHRIQLLAEAIRNNWLEKSYYSFEGGYKNWYNQLKNITDIDKNTILSIKDQYPLRLNITEQRHNPTNITTDDIKYHSNSYFSIVTETIMKSYEPKDGNREYMDTLFLTEKIYKPIAFKHPFIVFSWQGTLKFLKNYGYKTFHPYIDESYDNEPDYDKRFKMLIEEIKRLEQFDNDQWVEWQENIKPIVEYNAKYLLSLTEHSSVIKI